MDSTSACSPVPTLALLRLMRGPRDQWYRVPARLYGQCDTLVGDGLMEMEFGPERCLYRLSPRGAEVAAAPGAPE